MTATKRFFIWWLIGLIPAMAITSWLYSITPNWPMWWLPAALTAFCVIPALWFIFAVALGMAAKRGDR